MNTSYATSHFLASFVFTVHHLLDIRVEIVSHFIAYFWQLQQNTTKNKFLASADYGQVMAHYGNFAQSLSFHENLQLTNADYVLSNVALLLNGLTHCGLWRPCDNTDLGQQWFS